LVGISKPAIRKLARRAMSRDPKMHQTALEGLEAYLREIISGAIEIVESRKDSVVTLSDLKKISKFSCQTYDFN
jgi:histone H3/H4